MPDAAHRIVAIAVIIIIIVVVVVLVVLVVVSTAVIVGIQSRQVCLDLQQSG